jgi:hypothetical protein
MKLLIMKFSPLPCYLVPRLNTLFSNTLSLRSSLNDSDQVSHLITEYNYVKNGQIFRKITAFILEHFQQILSLHITIKRRFRMRKHILNF